MKNFLLIILFFLASVFAKAETKQKPDIVQFTLTKIFGLLQGSTVTAGYMIAKNESSKEVILKILKVDGFKKVEAHRTLEIAGQMKMEKVEEFKIAPHATLELKPGGNHIMLFDPLKPIKVGDTLTAQFSIDGVVVQVDFKVESRNK